MFDPQWSGRVRSCLPAYLFDPQRTRMLVSECSRRFPNSEVHHGDAGIFSFGKDSAGEWIS
jgi:hypothetical protein